LFTSSVTQGEQQPRLLSSLGCFLSGANSEKIASRMIDSMQSAAAMTITIFNSVSEEVAQPCLYY